MTSSPSSPLPGSMLRWPNGARVAFAVLVNLEHVDWQPPQGAIQSAGFPGSYGAAPYPDVRAWSHREYGNRVGAFRVFEILDRLGLKPSVAIDALTVTGCPELVRRIRNSHYEVVGHGIAVTRLLSQAMDEDEEYRQVTRALDVLKHAFGTRPLGWHGPEYGQSARTPSILAQLGFRYMLDWPDDEQPRRMATAAGEIISLPMMVELDDVLAHWQRRVPLAQWKCSLVDGVDRLAACGDQGGRVFVLTIHPWLIGQPWRSTHLREALAEIVSRDDLWFATCGEIVDRAAPLLPAPIGEMLIGGDRTSKGDK